ncbi:hypothetical protein ThidrDRAFT_3770 [Thiorhodococcus drewsii AZ1]|uniref:Uncharacterized protein n=1 Tax=Thiorhodococcus drewsii AZ1 TaxID=765913 RepID=G2E657_9GAMM|nr:hypothetical protein ThidrDRAFT_3770 [Thiorhodococcus drewsii AZ1]
MYCFLLLVSDLIIFAICVILILFAEFEVELKLESALIFIFFILRL